MPDFSNKITNFVGREIDAAIALIGALNDWRELRREWDAQAYATLITDADLVDKNDHVAAVDLANAFNALDAAEAALAAGHLTNLYKLLP